MTVVNLRVRLRSSLVAPCSAVVFRLFGDSGPQALYLHLSLGSLVTVILRLFSDSSPRAL